MKVVFESYEDGNCMDIECETDFERSVFKSLFKEGVEIQKSNGSIRLSSPEAENTSEVEDENK